HPIAVCTPQGDAWRLDSDGFVVDSRRDQDDLPRTGSIHRCLDREKVSWHMQERGDGWRKSWEADRVRRSWARVDQGLRCGSRTAREKQQGKREAGQEPQWVRAHSARGDPVKHGPPHNLRTEVGGIESNGFPAGGQERCVPCPRYGSRGALRG